MTVVELPTLYLAVERELATLRPPASGPPRPTGAPASLGDRVTLALTVGAAEPERLEVRLGERDRLWWGGVQEACAGLRVGESQAFEADRMSGQMWLMERAFVTVESVVTSYPDSTGLTSVRERLRTELLPQVLVDSSGRLGAALELEPTPDVARVAALLVAADLRDQRAVVVPIEPATARLVAEDIVGMWGARYPRPF